ncbi:MAG: PIN domain-containing protein [Pseudomonadota bacterium]
MRVLIDANVLYPTVLREIVLGVAAAGGFTPLWSARILEEWALAAAKRAPEDEAVARGEIALLRAAWPAAEVAQAPKIEARLWLPDPGDVHVLAAAVAGQADVILTQNLRDFPLRVLAAEGIGLSAPDPFLMNAFGEDPEGVRSVVAKVHGTAERLAGAPIVQRTLLKRARLPRLGKALAG